MNQLDPRTVHDLMNLLASLEINAACLVRSDMPEVERREIVSDVQVAIERLKQEIQKLG